MAYGRKYTIPYYRKSGSQTTVDILQKDYAGAVTTLKGGESPWELFKESSISNIYAPTIGVGSVLNVVSTSSLSLVEFYTADPQEFMVKVYNGATGTTLIWQGFVSTEIYKENYSNALSQVVSVYCNDGMKILEWIKYTETDGSYYTGTVTVGTILSNVLGKLGLTFSTIYTSNDLEVFDDGDTQITNPFLYLKLPNENFINEQGEAMSCRQVLDSVIGGLGGLTMMFLADAIYIFDPINLHDTSKGKSYTASTYGDETVISTLGGYLDISTPADNVTWQETGTMLDILPSVDEAVVKYDPYTLSEIAYNLADSNNWSVAGTFSDETDYWQNLTVEFTDWESSNSAGTSFAAVKESQYGTPDYFILLGGTGGHLITWTVPLSNITQDQNVQMKISFEAWVVTKENSLNIYSDGASIDIHQIKVPITVQVGDQTWNGGNQWNEDSSFGDQEQILYIRQEGVSDAEFAADNTLSIINDRWTNVSIIVPLKQSATEQLIEGDIIISILDYYKLHFANPILPSGSAGSVYYVLLKNPKITFIDAAGGVEIGNNGIETRGVRNTNLGAKSPTIIEATCGTGVFGCSRGAFKTDSQVVIGTNIAGLYRGDLDSNLTQYTTMQLLLQSFLSQYKTPRYVLNGKLDVSSYLLDILFKLIKYSDHLSDKAFYIAEVTYYDRREVMEATLLEIEDTRELIAE